MSIRTNPMKAVPTLLKRLSTAEKRADLNDLKSELMKIKDLFSMVKKNEDELLDTLMVVDGYLRTSNLRKLMDEKEEICKRIRDSTQKLLPAGAIQSNNTEAAQSSHKVTFQGVKLNKREEMNTAIPSNSQLEEFKVNYDNLDNEGKRCFLSLLFFPENAVINKRNLILWWTRVGFVKMTTEKTAIQKGWYVFDKLVDYQVIVRPYFPKFYVYTKCKISPWIHNESVRPLFQNDEERLFGFHSPIITSSHRSDTLYECLTLDQQKVKLSDGFGNKFTHCRAVFNVGASYLNLEPQWMANMERLEVLQLGHWLRDSPSRHVEVESEEFLKQLRKQKHLKYLSLRGISRISELPPSIFQLESLETLDLKACHNLATLPNDIASLRNLRYLNLSKCYLLDRMPKGIEKLTKLKVLKGFVLGSSSKSPCRISDIAKLKKLERLSIYIASGAVIKDGEFESLKELSKLWDLKISWGVSDTRYSDIQISLPPHLNKLHVEGFPGQNIPEWLKPHDLPFALKQLCITGGKLNSMNLREYVGQTDFEILRLKYLKHLNLEPANLQELFRHLRYIEIKRVLSHQDLEWSAE